MKQIKYLWLGIIIFSACSQADRSVNSRVEILGMGQKIRQQYAPDHRTAIFDLEIRKTVKGIVLKGKTDHPKAKAKLLSWLDQQQYGYIDSISILPDPALGENICGLINISVANLRTEPEHEAELATQALLGTPVKILESNNGWYHIQTPDGYISWTDDGAIALLSKQKLDSIKSVKKLIFTQPYGFSYSKPDLHAMPVSDLVMGCILNVVTKDDDFYEVSYPDKRIGYVAAKAAEDFDQWSQKMSTSPEKFVHQAEELIGLPYLWGGTSAKAVDCSGFTKTVYLMNGLVLPRDASQQNTVGEVVDSVRKFKKLEPGDLLFFGRKATTNSSESIVHVGMWIGNMKFIHASGDVHISSMDSTQPDFDRYNYDRYIRAKRILGNKSTLENLSVHRLYGNFPG